MTSKALKLAAQALWDFARPDGSPKLVADLRADAREIVLARTADIIRAFAQNISDDAMDAAALVIWSDMARSDSPKFSPEIVQAAIEKDLE